MSSKIGHKHTHARDDLGFPGCHMVDCRCSRCILEAGAEIPRDRRAKILAYRESVSEMYRCDKCGGIKVAYLDADTHATYKIPATLWCMTCGRTQLAGNAEKPTSLQTRVGSIKPKVSLAQRMAGLLPKETRHTEQPEAKTAKRDWTPEERRDLKTLIDAKGVSAGSRAYCAKYPERGRTEQGCAYQWNTQISKGKGLK